MRKGRIVVVVVVVVVVVILARLAAEVLAFGFGSDFGPVACFGAFSGEAW